MSGDRQFIYSLEVRILELQDRVVALEETLSDLKRDAAPTDASHVANLPASVTERIAAGGHPVRVIRRHRMMTQKTLGDLCGIRANHISAIERGRSYGLKTAKRLAAALDVPVGLIS